MHVRKVHRLAELAFKPRLGSKLHVLDISSDLTGLGSNFGVEQRQQGALPGCVADGVNLLQSAARKQTHRDCALLVKQAAKCPGKDDNIRRFDPEPFHQQFRTAVQGLLRQLKGPDVGSRYGYVGVERGFIRPSQMNIYVSIAKSRAGFRRFFRVSAGTAG